MKNEKVYNTFCLMALTVPAAEAAVGTNWLPTMVVALAAFLLCTWMNGREDPQWKWLSALRMIVICLLIAWLLDWTHSCWPGNGAAYVVPAALLIAAVWAVGRGSETAQRAANVLRYGMYLVLGVLLFSGIKNLSLDKLYPSGELPDLSLCAVLLLPLLAQKTGRGNPIGLTALLAAIVTAGTGATSLYTYSRGLSIRGIAEHIESVTACAVTVGFFAALCFLLENGKREWTNVGKGSAWFVLLLAAAAYLIYALAPQPRAEAYVVSEVILWVLIPLIWNIKIFLSKKRKTS